VAELDVILVVISHVGGEQGGGKSMLSSSITVANAYPDISLSAARREILLETLKSKKRKDKISLVVFIFNKIGGYKIQH
jgi:hypothetical protein